MNEEMLPAGDYILWLQPNWQGSVDHPDFLKVLVDVYSTREIELQRTSESEGIDSLVNTCRGLALGMNKDYYWKSGGGDYAKLWRTASLNAFNSWLGFVYFANDSS
jgi:hypothetical protein